MTRRRTWRRVRAAAAVLLAGALAVVAGCGGSGAGTATRGPARQASGAAWPPPDWGIVACPQATPNFPYTLVVRNLLPVPLQLAAGGTDCAQWSGERTPAMQLNTGASVWPGATGRYALTPREYVARNWTMGFAIDWTEVGRAPVSVPKAAHFNEVNLVGDRVYTEIIETAWGYRSCLMTDLGRTDLPATRTPDLIVVAADGLTVFVRLGHVVVASNCRGADEPSGTELTILLRNDLPAGGDAPAGYPRLTLRASGESVCWDYQQLGWKESLTRPAEPAAERRYTTAPVLGGVLVPPWCRSALKGFPHYGGFLPFIQERPGSDWVPLRREGHASELLWYEATSGVELGDGFYVFVPPEGITMTSAAGRSVCMSGAGFTPTYPWLGPKNAAMTITVAPTCPPASQNIK